MPIYDHSIDEIIEAGKIWIRQTIEGIDISEIIPGLFQSSSIRWPKDGDKVKSLGIDTIIDLSGGFDSYISSWIGAYLFWPIKDEPILPDIDDLRAVVNFGKSRFNSGHKVLTHCTEGFNRSGLVNAILVYLLLNVDGEKAIEIIQKARPRALYNQVFVDFLKQIT